MANMAGVIIVNHKYIYIYGIGSVEERALPCKLLTTIYAVSWIHYE